MGFGEVELKKLRVLEYGYTTRDIGLIYSADLDKHGAEIQELVDQRMVQYLLCPQVLEDSFERRHLTDIQCYHEEYSLR